MSLKILKNGQLLNENQKKKKKAKICFGNKNQSLNFVPLFFQRIAKHPSFFSWVVQISKSEQFNFIVLHGVIKWHNCSNSDHCLNYLEKF